MANALGTLVRLSLVILSLGLLACQEDPNASLKNPAASDLVGRWESLSIYQYFPYALIEFNTQAEGRAVLVSPSGDPVELSLSGFESHAENFTIWLGGLDDNESEQWQGSIRYGQLCFQMADGGDFTGDEKFIFCFTRSREILAHRAVAEKALILMDVPALAPKPAQGLIPVTAPTPNKTLSPKPIRVEN
ncbi:MAG: hypothetical protein ACI93R_002158 [Flavobacteriales bacterium]|jgi:hypothetical protein